MLYSPPPMHIPDGFLSVLVSIGLWILVVPLIGVALRRTNRELEDRQAPLMGVLAAAIFAGQMLNFTVAGGTSGHLLGAAIAAILLGPWPAVLVMTAVVSIQALLFQDGGLLALGANLFNMAAVGVFAAHAAYTLLRKLFNGSRRGIFIAGFAAAWLSIFIASLAAALQLALSGTSPANIAVPAMAGIHAIIGMGEGLITLGALVFLYSTRRDLLNMGAGPELREKGILVGGALISLALVILSPLASSHPDGLEWVAEQKGFIALARDAVYNIIPDYVFPGISNPALATIAAGVLGIVIVFGIAFGVARGNHGKSESQPDAG